jgi:hypothetical protein
MSVDLAECEAIMPSTAIEDFHWRGMELTVVFTTGRVYVYRNVPRAVFDAFAAVPSKGAFFNSEIRDRYPYRELTLSK